LDGILHSDSIPADSGERHIGTISKETEEDAPRAARADTTDGGLRKHGETVGGKYNATLWLVGAETSLYAAWLGVYCWQLLRDAVGPVGRRDLAG
jgi:hypothetical protein